MTEFAVPAAVHATLDRIEHLDAFLAHMLQLAGDQASDIHTTDAPLPILKSAGDRCAATIVVAMEFREQIMAEVDKLREALAHPALAA